MAFTVTNNLDDVAIYLGLTRLPGETDESFTSRIKRFANIRYGIDYKTSVRSITEQIGLRMVPVARVFSSVPFTCVMDEDYLILETFPVSGTNGYLRMFINYNTVDGEMQTRFIDGLGGVGTLTLDIIDNSGFNSLRRETLFRGSNFVTSHGVISQKRNMFKEKIIPGSISSNSQYMVTPKASPQEIKNIGDYFVDYEINYIEIYSDPSDIFSFMYKEYEEQFIIYKTQFNLISLNSYSKYGLNDNFISLLDSYLLDKSLG